MNKENINENLMVIKYKNTNDVVGDVCSIIESARDYAYKSVNIALLERNWLIGYRIAEEELKGNGRADYGFEVLKKLSKELKKTYGKGFEMRNLYYFLQFYKTFPNILHSVNAKSNILLSWTHYKILLQVEDKKAREWYERETAEQTWSVRTLQRNISSQYYYRLLKSQSKEPVIREMKEKNKEHYLMNKLEEDYYIDLVFYNYILKCFVLIDLKTKKITHQDVGQMDMYVRMYDELKKSKDDNPTIGIVLCSETDEDIAKYSILKGNEQLFATKYKLYLPTEDELRAEIENQKTLFELQQQENDSEKIS